MRYTFTDKDGEQQTVDIPQEVINNNKRNLGCSTSEAIDLYLFDEGYVRNETADALTRKAKENNAGNRVNSKKRKPARTPDTIKRNLISNLQSFLKSSENIENIEILNPERVISFTLGEETYELTLSKKRKPKIK